MEASGGGGSGLDKAAVLALINTSLGGVVQPSGVTATGAGKSYTAFSFDTADGGEESKIEQEGNGERGECCP